MRISQMIEREDFFGILEKTVYAYFKTVRGREIYFGYEKQQGTVPLIINGKFSFISAAPIAEGLREFLKSEYNIRGSKLKYFIGKISVFAVSLIPFAGKTRTAYISAGALGKNEFISPQNRSVRFFDYDKMTVDCIIKNGFTDKYFRNQIDFRKQYKYDFMLPMLGCGDNWFKEPILSGHPLARVTCTADYNRGIEDSQRAINILAQDTLETVSSGEYAGGLFKKISVLLDEAKKRKNIKFSAEMKNLAKACAEYIEKNSFNISTVMSHGDLQTGNIWVDQNKKTWIYDWETAGRRSIWYDSSVLGYSLRRLGGWQRFLNDAEAADMFRCDFCSSYSQAEILSAKKVVLLEDILFYLEDMLELPEDWGNKIFDNLCGRILPLFEKI